MSVVRTQSGVPSQAMPGWLTETADTFRPHKGACLMPRTAHRPPQRLSRESETDDNIGVAVVAGPPPPLHLPHRQRCWPFLSTTLNLPAWLQRRLLPRPTSVVATLAVPARRCGCDLALSIMWRTQRLEDSDNHSATATRIGYVHLA